MVPGTAAATDDSVGHARMQEYAECTLLRMMQDARVLKSNAYTPGEVQRVLCISSQTFARLCDAYTPEGHANRDPKGLESFRPSAHRRVAHRALVDWVRRNLCQNN